jgi:uncharacterized damage-inducible protein DinB
MTARTRLLKEFQYMQQERHALLAALEGHDATQLARCPAPGAWSVAQVIAHLTMAEEGALAYLRKKLAYGGHAPPGVAGGMRLTLLRAALALPKRWKAPPMIAQVPEVDWPTALARWEAVRMDMRDTYAQLPPGVEYNALFKHPVAGRMDLVQGLRFMRSHVQHHRAQIERALKTVGAGH